MAETIGTITNIKVFSFLQGGINAFDTCIFAEGERVRDDLAVPSVAEPG